MEEKQVQEVLENLDDWVFQVFIKFESVNCEIEILVNTLTLEDIFPDESTMLVLTSDDEDSQNFNMKIPIKNIKNLRADQKEKYMVTNIFLDII